MELLAKSVVIGLTWIFILSAIYIIAQRAIIDRDDGDEAGVFIGIVCAVSALALGVVSTIMFLT